jgi:hypothetical protein
VLKQCLSDSEPNVRWPSVLLLQRCGTILEQEEAFKALLDDPDKEVRLQAIAALGRLRREVLSAIPKLTELAQSDDLDVATAARFALWSIDTNSAIRAEGWKEFKSDEWDFVVQMPGKVEVRSGKAKLSDSDLHSYWAWSGASCFTVAVSFELSGNEFTPEERYDRAAQLTAEAMQATVERNAQVEQFGKIGRDQRLRYNRGVFAAKRVFIVGDRIYHANVMYAAGQLHPDAIAYYLDSFQISWQPLTNSEAIP